MCNQAVEHSMSECVFGESDWAVGINGATLHMYKPFLHHSMGMGFGDLNTTSSWRTTLNVEGFSTEGIEGLYFLRSLNSPQVFLKFRHTQPVFWNQLNTTDIDPYLIAMSDARGVIDFDGGDWFMSNVGGGPRNIKIRMGNTAGRPLSTLKTRDVFVTSNQIGIVRFENRGTFNFEGNTNGASNTQATNGAYYRATIRTSGDQWVNYLASGTGADNLMSLTWLLNNPTPNGNSIATNNHSTPWFDIGDMSRGTTLGINVSAKRFVPNIDTVGAYTLANYFTANTFIKGVGFAKMPNSGIFEGASASSFEISYSRLYIGDQYKIDRWGYLQFYTAGNKNINPINPVVYTTNEPLILTATYYSPNASISGSTLTGTGFNTALSANLAGRTCRIMTGAFAGVEFTITSVNTSTQMTIVPPAGITVTGSFDFIIMAKLVAVTGSNAYGVVTLITEQANRFAAGLNASTTASTLENLL